MVVHLFSLMLLVVVRCMAQSRKVNVALPGKLILSLTT